MTSLDCTGALLTLAAPNWDEVVSFYTHLLGDSPVRYQSGVYAEFQRLGLRLGIFKPKATQEAEFVGNHRSALSLCIEVRDLDTAIRHLTQLGYSPSLPILQASHGRELYLYDPIGTRLIVYQSTPDIPPPQGEDPALLGWVE